MSSQQLINEDWAFCSYDGDVYVTIRNAGNSSYEGDYYITSSSSAANLQNFFVYNHSFSADYLDSGYDPVLVKTEDYQATVDDGVIIMSSAAAIDCTLPSAATMEGKRLTIKRAGAEVVTVFALSGETIDGADRQELSSDYDSITVISDGGSAWYVL
jgi:hypothetical protein